MSSALTGVLFVQFLDQICTQVDEGAIFPGRFAGLGQVCQQGKEIFPWYSIAIRSAILYALVMSWVIATPVT